jgi:hypothetical protein
MFAYLRIGNSDPRFFAAYRSGRGFQGVDDIQPQSAMSNHSGMIARALFWGRGRSPPRGHNGQRRPLKTPRVASDMCRFWRRQLSA